MRGEVGLHYPQGLTGGWFTILVQRARGIYPRAGMVKINPKAWIDITPDAVTEQGLSDQYSLLDGLREI